MANSAWLYKLVPEIYIHTSKYIALNIFMLFGMCFNVFPHKHKPSIHFLYFILFTTNLVPRVHGFLGQRRQNLPTTNRWPRRPWTLGTRLILNNTLFIYSRLVPFKLVWIEGILLKLRFPPHVYCSWDKSLRQNKKINQQKIKDKSSRVCRP